MHLIDGGLSTELERLGAQIRGQLWTGQNLLSAPELVKQAHENFVAAGAEVIITSSYQLSRQGFEEIGLTSADANNALRTSVKIAKEAVADTDVKVAASIGPYGAILHDGSEFRGDYKVSQTQLEEFHAERLEEILRSKPDMLAIETIPNVVEAKALAKLLKTVEIPFWFSFTAGSESNLWSGEPIKEAASEISELSGLFAVGVNCLNPELVLPLVSEIHEVTSIPAIAYPNAGGKWDATIGKWVGQSNKSLAEWVQLWRDSPIEWVGGCCGSSAIDVKAVAKILN